MGLFTCSSVQQGLGGELLPLTYPARNTVNPVIPGLTLNSAHPQRHLGQRRYRFAALPLCRFAALPLCRFATLNSCTACSGQIKQLNHSSYKQMLMQTPQLAVARFVGRYWHSEKCCPKIMSWHVLPVIATSALVEPAAGTLQLRGGWRLHRRQERIA
jgi:hypothetical protein